MKDRDNPLRGWEPVTLLMPKAFRAAAADAAYRQRLPAREYCRQALILKLAADGVRLDDYETSSA